MTLVLDFPMWMRLLLAGLGVAIVFSCLCRAKHMTHQTTALAIRYATTALAGAGFVLILAAALRPDWVVGSLTAMAFASLSVQAASARYWRKGLPQQFRRSS